MTLHILDVLVQYSTFQYIPKKILRFPPTPLTQIYMLYTLLQFSLLMELLGDINSVLHEMQIWQFNVWD